jgi:hypothetical protein
MPTRKRLREWTRRGPVPCFGKASWWRRLLKSVAARIEPEPRQTGFCVLVATVRQQRFARAALRLADSRPVN